MDNPRGPHKTTPCPHHRIKTRHTSPDPTTQHGRLTRLAWYFYDFGNTSVEFAIPYYLTPWIITGLGVSPLTFGLASAASSWAIGLSGPYIGVNADEKHRRRHWFVASVVLATFLFGILNIIPHSSLAGVIGVLVAAMLANYFFQLSSLIYNASLLNASEGANVVSVSSLGMALSFLGGVVGVGVIQVFISGKIIPGVAGEGYALLPAAGVFLICTIPSMFSTRLWPVEVQAGPPPAGSLHHRMKELWQESARQYRAGWFLGGYFALNSAIMGLTLYLTLHIQAVTDLEGIRLWAVLLGAVLSSAAGAGAVAYLRPNAQQVRRIIIWGLTLWGFNALAFSLMSSVATVALCACLHGFFSGALVPTVRGAFARTFRTDYQALAFGLFGAVQRISQGLGAALSPLATSIASGPRATAAGIAAMGALALIGVPLFAKWRLADTISMEMPAQESSLETALSPEQAQPSADEAV